DSTNGTLVNDQRVEGECELHDQDRVRVGPLEFRVACEAGKPVAAAHPAWPADDEAVAAMLLSVADDPDASDSKVDVHGVPTGSTVMEMLAPGTPTPPPGSEKAPVNKAEAAK